MNDKLTLGSLFDGAGTTQLAAKLCGIEPIWSSEIEKFPIAVSSKRFPKTQLLGDIRDIDGAKIPPVDIIVGGSPCQDLSSAGKRAGLKGEKSSLFMEQICVIKEMRNETKDSNKLYPRFAVWENVPGALTSNRGEDFRIVLQEFCRISLPEIVIPRPNKSWTTSGAILANEFSIAWRVFDAQYWGVAQRRRRIYLVADFDGQCAIKILFNRAGLHRSFKEIRETLAPSTKNF